MSGSRQKKVRKLVKAVFYRDFFKLVKGMSFRKRLGLALRVIFIIPYKGL